MTDTPPDQTPPGSAGRPEDGAKPLRPASPVRRTAARAARASVSLIWLVPVAALLITLGLAWNAYSGRGTQVTVAFTDATGITPGETQLRFRAIPVGEVEAVRFTPDLQQVLVDIRVATDVAQYIDDEAQFWIVRPQVTTQGISRLDTVLTGAFIEGSWDADPGPATDEVHQGLDRPPLTRSNEQGTWVLLAGDTAKGMSEGAPIYFRGLPVGRMQNLRLADRDERVLADVFIESPHDQRLTSATVFWDISGFSVGLGPQGVQLNVTSVTSLLQGGAEFATIASGGQPVETGHVFQLYPDRETAQNQLFAGSPQDELRLTLLLPDAVRGLTEGADVQFQGLTVGRVTNLAVRVADQPGGEPGQVMQDITIAVSPQRMGLDEGAGPEDALAFLSAAVADGLRARVTGAGFFGTSLMIELVELPDAPPAQIVAAEPHPVMPAAPADLSDISDTAQGFMTRIGNLKLEELLKSATDMMDSVTAIASSQDTRAIPQSLRRTIDEAQVTMTELRTAAQELRASGAAANIGIASEQASQLATKLNEAADRVPGIVESLETATTSVSAVDFAAIGAELQAALRDVRAVIGSDAARQLPGALTSAASNFGTAAEDIGVITAELRAAQAGLRLSQALDDASAAFRAVEDAAAEMPEMVDSVYDAAESFDEIDFLALSLEAQGLITDLRIMLGSEDAAALPRNLSDTLEAASGLLNDLRDGNAAGSLNAALESARVAMDQIATAANTLPALSQRFQQLAARGEAVLSSYGGGGAFQAEIINTLRGLRRAADAFGSLSQTIERNPRAFIMGR
ncbi:MCE family protein [Paracoccus sp. Z118]|uniref:MlaD family protein n=1 Tax=Paracoccus sp. Z118 TaxID=2851017 RepID=UPI001C2C103C|nr:MlaD family protein [Paracoccus sp. Z118]MBV0891968.1 MCE family protein [Paracoccus sp. Z118]